MYLSRWTCCFFVALLLVVPCSLLFAIESIYEAPDAFVSRHFNGEPPAPSMLYPKQEIKESIKNILGHRYSKFRIRYWLKDNRSVWILQEIGKERFITSGFAVDTNRIREAKVLVFRESRGWEVRYDSFADQFTDAKLTSTLELDRSIDNISGATLSVRAVTKLARLALLLHNSVAS
ncbi:MAG: FMN-binding protein [Gammaproteobacteria bacterium]|nr:FMN-binding protein [Gammaproteobacteria bacterium]